MCVSTHPATHPRTYAHARNHAHPYTHTHTRARGPLMPLKHAKQHACMHAPQVECSTGEEVMAAFQRGVGSKVMAAHRMNDASSRSHCLCTLYINSAPLASPNELISSRLTLVDLVSAACCYLVPPIVTRGRVGLPVHTSCPGLAQRAHQLAPYAGRVLQVAAAPWVLHAPAGCEVQRGGLPARISTSGLARWSHQPHAGGPGGCCRLSVLCACPAPCPSIRARSFNPQAGSERSGQVGAEGGVCACTWAGGVLAALRVPPILLGQHFWLFGPVWQ